MRLRATLRDFFPAALDAFDDLAGTDALELLEHAPDPAQAAKLSRTRIVAALRRAHRHHAAARAEQIHAALHREQLALPAQLVAAYAAIVRAACPLIATFNTQISQLQQHVQDLFDQHPDVEIYRSQPGLGDILGARVLGEFGEFGEFGDEPDRFGGARARKNYAGNSPITRASGKKRTVTARRVRNNRLADPLHQQAFSALTCSPGARAYYDRIRARGASHHAALRQLSNRLVGILHGCLASRTLYDEAKAWSSAPPDARAG
jgi:hypothetical protein